jgi:hypothetical protein
LLLVGAAQAALAAVHAPTLGPGGAGLLAWSGVTWGAVGTAYLLPGVGPSVFGKRGDGTLPPWRVAFLLPYLLGTWGLWEARTRLSPREHPFDEVAPGLFLGRRPRGPADLPAGVGLVVDLTAEFPAARGIADGSHRYVCVPTLDADAPSDRAAFGAAVDEIERSLASGRSIYIHCALGRGRSAMTVAAVMRRRYALGTEPAGAVLATVHAARTGIRLSHEQVRLLERL